MIHTVYIDDSSTKGRRLLQHLQKEQDVVRFKKPENVDIIDGYMTSTKFRLTVKQGLISKLKSNGCL